MKKILWLCNTVLPELFSRLGVYNVKEGWLIGISQELRKQRDIELHYVCPQAKEKRIVNIKKEAIHFHCFYAKYDNLYTIEKDVRDQIGKIIKVVHPDIIHIFGTEMPHTVACVESVEEKEKIVISIQGLVSEYAKYYLNGIPYSAYLNGSFYNGRYQTIWGQYKEFCKRAENEIRAIKKVKHVIGRTEWDKACTNIINSNCKYHYCSETLRNCFYGKKWDISKIEKHSVFVSQGDYPIKGLHNLLNALPYVIERYPETKIYVAGANLFLNKGEPYAECIKKMIVGNNLEKHIIFLGILDAKRMCRYLLKSHLMVMPSNIENSPNSIGEAMLVGTPVVASFVGGIPSIVQNEREGLLYQQGSAEMLSHSICKIFENDLLANTLSANARKHAANLYDREKNMRKLLEIYNCI